MAGAGDVNGKGAASSSSSKQTRKRRKGPAPSSRFSFLNLVPSDIVCTDRDLKKSKKSTELALLLGLAVICLYFFGFSQLMQSMPEISSRIGHYKMGGNLNLARMEMDSGIGNNSNSNNKEEIVDVDTTSNSLKKTSKEKKQKQKQKKEKEKEKVHKIAPPTVTNDETNNDGKIPIPVGTWPVSVRGEEQETMIHVGDLETVMKVPKFWSPPVHNNEQFTREQAMKIGTCAEPDPITGSNVRGEDCPILQRTIFIGIASYRDYQCRQTLETAFRRAENPKRIRVGVVDQIVVGEDVRCDEPMKPCEEDPEQVRIEILDTVRSAAKRE